MLRRNHVSRVGACALLGLLAIAGQPAVGSLIGIDKTGQVYQVSTTNASLTTMLNVGVTDFADIAYAPDGTLYGVTETRATFAGLYTIDLNSGSATRVRDVSTSMTLAEGALAFDPAGIAYIANLENALMQRKLLKLNLQTGENSVIPLTNHDLNGMVWRPSDGKLVALDRMTNALIVINPADGTSTKLADVPMVGGASVGSVGGLTVQNGIGYFYTGGLYNNNGIVGSDRLYSFDLNLGNVTLIGELNPAQTGWGLAGLAAPIPEPVTLGLLALGIGLLGRRLRSR